MSDLNDVNSSGDKHDEQQEPDELIFKNLDQFTAKNDSVTHKTTSTSTNPPSILDFCIVKPISKGAFGKVFLGYKNSKPSLLYAIKVMKKSEMINKNMVSQVITERNVLALSQSPFCVTLFYSLQSSSSIYLVMEYMVGGDLKSILAMYGFFDEATSRFYCAEILLALQYLHKHGIIHRDIKPDNMLVGADGHVKLTDFGLSKIDLHRDLEMSDLINCSPSLNTRTPGQLLSLTSHLSFGSNEKKTSRTETLASVKESEQSKIDSSMNDSKISGVSPFFSAEDINFSTSMTRKLMKIVESSGSSYTTADASTASSNIYMTSSANDIQINIECDSTSDSDKENSAKNFSFSMVPVKSVAFKFHEDSGISSRKSDTSTNNQYENSAANYSNANTTSSDLSRSNISDKSKHELHSPIRPTGRGFKRPDFHRSMSRKRTLTNHAEFSIEGDGCQHTGLTQEIEINLDIGSSTPKKHKSQSHASPGNLFKIKSSPDDSIRLSAINPSLIVSTPVSTQKITRGKKNNMLRFAIPHSSVERQRLLQYSKLTDDPAVSPIQNAVRSIDEITPKMAKTPFRTPKSVRRGVMGSDAERILGTPDYLAPELLMMKGHGMAVDWWALGVCLYEFMTGIPPFNDETPQKVFENILNRNIEWPVDDEALSEESMEMVESMLTMSPSARPSAEECKAMKFFASVDFDNILNANPPFVPSLDDPLDTGYFQARNEMQHLELSNFEMS